MRKDNHLPEFIRLMQNANLNKLVIDSFSRYYEQILSGSTGKLSKKEISPPEKKNLIDYNQLEKPISSHLEKLVVIKLNGGLGTSMGLTKVKSLLRVKEDFNFLDIIIRQILYLREKSKKNIPLLFMNSFNTRDDTLSYLEKYPELKLPEIPLDFLQNKFSKIKQSDLSPLQNRNDNLNWNPNWNPPGHGEIYLVLMISGVLEQLLDSGFEYAFLSNSDNLGAVVDEKILNYFVESNISFMMEVCKRSSGDRKGGHLAQTRDGRLVLRETVQCPEQEISEFQDIEKYQYFNTNNLWVNLKALKDELIKNDYLLPLSLIINPKEVEGEKVYQIETAMGAAISVFEDSKAVVVNRDRFAPVKKTNDLLIIWSDAYKLQQDYKLVLDENLEEPPKVILEERYYKTIEQLEEHCKDGIPSLKNCRKLEISADVFFGKNVEIIGDVKITKDGKREKRRKGEREKGRKRE